MSALDAIRRRAGLAVAGLALASVLVWAGAAARADTLDWRGYNELRWRVRATDATDATDDQDLYDTLVLSGRGRNLGFQLHGSLLHDLEGLAPKDRPERFAGLPDTYADRTHGYLYSAYVDLGGDPGFGRPLLRLGRQWRYQAETVQFDGAALCLRPLPVLEVSAVGGVPVHLYESSSAGDVLAGAGLRLLPSRALELGADILRLRDRREGGSTLEDDLLQASAVLRGGEDAVLRGEASWTGSELRRLSVRGSLEWEPLGLGLTGAAVRQPAHLDDLVTEVTPYVQLLGVSRPYQSYLLNVRKDLGRDLAVETGGTLRYLEDLSDESAYNHDFARYHASLLAGSLPGGLDLEVIGEVWQAEGGDDARSLGASVRKDLGGFRAEAGTEFALFKYDLLTGQERENVRTWYLRLATPRGRSWGFRLAWEVEDAPGVIFHVVDLSIRRSF